MRMAVSGSHGFIGEALCRRMTEAGHVVLRIVRNAPCPPGELFWDVRTSRLPETFEDLDAVVHLAGSGIANGRWTPARMATIRTSRVESTRRLVEGLGSLRRPPRAFLCASATGYYGKHGEQPMDETAPPGVGFLPSVCREWEDAADTGAPPETRVVLLRFGMVLAPQGGALARMLPVFRLGLGGPLGGGRFYMSWIDLADACEAIAYLASHTECRGPYNLTAPHPVTNRGFTKALGSALHRPAPWPVPGAVLRLMYGQMAREVLLQGVRALPARLSKAGFQFQSPTLDACFGRMFPTR